MKLIHLMLALVIAFQPALPCLCALCCLALCDAAASASCETDRCSAACDGDADRCCCDDEAADPPPPPPKPCCPPCSNGGSATPCCICIAEMPAIEGVPPVRTSFDPAELLEAGPFITLTAADSAAPCIMADGQTDPHIPRPLTTGDDHQAWLCVWLN